MTTTGHHDVSIEPGNGWQSLEGCPLMPGCEHPPSVAVRIDGDSMSPRYLDGDTVICSTEVAIWPGKPRPAAYCLDDGTRGVSLVGRLSDGTIIMRPIKSAASEYAQPRSRVTFLAPVIGTFRAEPGMEA